jgi:hypothetical protein
VSNGPAAAVVSGYGLNDVVSEGLGGWFCLRETNRLEFDVEQGKAHPVEEAACRFVARLRKLDTRSRY